MISSVEASEKESTDPILFYLPKDNYGFLCNFYPSPFQQNGKIYKTVEHYFQSQKFLGMPQEQQVIDSRKPRLAFELAKKWKGKRLPNWQHIKDDIMYTGLVKKFTLHKDLQEMLLSTKERILIEHTTNDDYWADGGGQGKGKNKLGQLLMRVRNEIRQGKI